VEWFGKSGIAWHGAMFIRRYVPADGGEVNPDEYVISYYDDITVGRSLRIDSRVESAWSQRLKSKADSC